MNMNDLAPHLAEFTKSATEKLTATAADVSEIKQKQTEVQARLQHVEQKLDQGTGHGGSGDELDGLWIEKALEGSAGFVALKAGDTQRCRISLPETFIKAPLSGVAGNPGAAAGGVDRRPGIVALASRKLLIRDLLRTVPTDAGLVQYVRQISETNASATVAETAQKPESTIGVTLESAKVVTIAHWMHASKQILDDAPDLQNFLEVRMRNQLLYVEEAQILKGSGTGENLNGLYTAATAFAAPFVITSPTPIDVIRQAMTQLELTNFSPSAVVLHPIDWGKIETLKTSDADYLRSNPNETNARTLWGLPVVVTAAMTSGAFLIGDFVSAATIYDRQQPTLDIATQDADDFTKNLVKLRMENRLALAIENAAALVKGTFA
jgi:HK97 family phage major capsid protein